MNEDLLKELAAKIAEFRSNALIQNKIETKETKETKVARLLVLLNEITNELDTVEKTLGMLWNQGYTTNNKELQDKSMKYIHTVKSLKLKIAQARLNLNYTFI